MRTILTKTGFETLKGKLSDKIDELKSLREEKAHAYSASGDGWHDNPGWTQLGQQEEMLAKEIFSLQQKISSAVILESGKMDMEKVNIGCFVVYQMIKNGVSSIHSMTIVGSGESDVKNKKISYDSPIGKALFNMRIGEEKDVQVPAGSFRIKIESINYE